MCCTSAGGQAVAHQLSDDNGGGGGSSCLLVGVGLGVGPEWPAADGEEAIDFERIRGGKPFAISVDWFGALLAEIGQPHQGCRLLLGPFS